MNLNDPKLIANPYPIYATWREEQPIWWSDGDNERTHSTMLRGFHHLWLDLDPS